MTEQEKTAAELVEDAKEEVPLMTCKEFEKIKAGGVEHVSLDVREPAEYEAGHIEGAVNIPRGLLEFKIAKAAPKKDTLIVICCQSGGRAALSGESLEEMGYTNVRYLEGGYEECKN